MRIFTCTFFSCLIAATAAFSQSKPNVIIVYTDDQGSVDANCYGSTDIDTPNLDALAETGIRFTQMLAPSAICSASRAGLLTGRIPARAGVPANVSSQEGIEGMPSDQVTMAEVFRDAGYATGHFGKWHIGYTPETMPNGQGFQYSFGHMGGCIDNYSHFFFWNGPNRHDLWRNGEHVWADGEYFGDLMQKELFHFLETKQEEPFFIYWAINWPHYPLQGTAKWRERYADLPHPRDKYAAFVSTTDEIVGNLMQKLDALGLRENTILVFQSDHGHSVEERTFGGGGSAGPYRGHKGNLFEGGIRVPSIVSWPAGLPQGEVRDVMVTGMDWFPTLTELSDVALPENHHIDGKSIVPVLKSSDAETPHETMFWRLGGNPDKSKWVVRKGDWKLIGNNTENVRPEDANELTKEDRELFLVNLSNDIGERNNVRDQHPDIVTELLAIRAEYEASLAGE